MTRFPITPEGYKKINEELEKLKTIERHKVIQDIAEARAHGDLSENAEYSAAKEKQGFIEAKIIDLESRISMAEIIDSTNRKHQDGIEFGAYVEIMEDETEKKVRYRIVGDYESDLNNRMISISSPLAKALIGKKIGDEAEVHTPNGMKYYEIIKIEY